MVLLVLKAHDTENEGPHDLIWFVTTALEIIFSLSIPLIDLAVFPDNH